MPRAAACSPDPLAGEMRTIVRTIAQPVNPGELIKQQINRAARRGGLTPRRTEDFWYGRGRVLAVEADRLRRALAEYRAARARALEQELALLRQMERAAGGGSSPSTGE